jgi:hypothetical protein
VGLKLAEPVARPDAGPTPQAGRFNRVTLANLLGEDPGRAIAAASYALGAGAPCQLFDLYMIERVQAGDSEANVDAWARDLGAGLNEAGRARLREVFVEALPIRLPILRAQGVF